MVVAPGRGSIRRIIAAVAGALTVALLAVPVASAATTPFTDIHSAGPLSDIYIGNDLGCQVRAGGFSSTEFFPNAERPRRLRDVHGYGLSDNFQAGAART